MPLFSIFNLVSWNDLVRPWDDVSKKGKKSGQPAEVQEIGQSRSINFNKEEYDMLLVPCREIQIQNVKTDLNFTSSEMQQIHALYSANNKGIPQTQLHLYNRLKTMKKKFNIFIELSTKSGWSWDYENHMVVQLSHVVFAKLNKVRQFKFLNSF